MCTHTCTHEHIYTHVHTHIRRHAYIHAHACTHMHTCTQMHIYIYTYMHAHIHNAHTCTHTCTRGSQEQLLGFSSFLPPCRFQASSGLEAKAISPALVLSFGSHFMYPCWSGTQDLPGSVSQTLRLQPSSTMLRH